jgi:hypothetical protein
MLPRAAQTTEPNAGSREASRSHPLRLVAPEAPSACETTAVCEEDEWKALLTRMKSDTQDLTEEQEWEAQLALVRAEVEAQEAREWRAQVERVKAQMALDEEREWLATMARMRGSVPPASSEPRHEYTPTHSSILPKPMAQARSTVVPAQPTEPASLRFTLPEEKAREEAAQKPAPSKLPPRHSSLGLPRVSSPSLLNGQRASTPSALPLRTTSQLARQSATTRPSQMPPRPVAKSTLPAAPQRPEVARLLARGKPRTEQEKPRAPQQSGVHRRSELQGAPSDAEAKKKKDSSLLILSRSLESIEKESAAARPSRTMPPAPPKSTWAPTKTLSGAAVAPKPEVSSDDEVWPDPKTLRGAAVAPEPAAQARASQPATRASAPQARPSHAGGKQPLRLPPLPPKGVSTKPKAPPPPLPRRAGQKTPASAARTAHKPLAIPAPPPRTAAESGVRHGFAQSVWSAVASFTTRGGSHK